MASQTLTSSWSYKNVTVLASSRPGLIVSARTGNQAVWSGGGQRHEIFPYGKKEILVFGRIINVSKNLLLTYEYFETCWKKFPSPRINFFYLEMLTSARSELDENFQTSRSRHCQTWAWSDNRLPWNFSTRVYEVSSIIEVNFWLGGATMKFVVYGQKVALFKLVYTKFKPKPTISLYAAWAVVLKMEKEEFRTVIKHFYLKSKHLLRLKSSWTLHHGWILFTFELMNSNQAKNQPKMNHTLDAQLRSPRREGLKKSIMPLWLVTEWRCVR